MTGSFTISGPGSRLDTANQSAEETPRDTESRRLEHPAVDSALLFAKLTMSKIGLHFLEQKPENQAASSPFKAGGSTISLDRSSAWRTSTTRFKPAGLINLSMDANDANGATYANDANDDGSNSRSRNNWECNTGCNTGKLDRYRRSLL
jgi:hypothetical protein